MQGVVETLEESVAPLETARLMSVFVQVGQRVKKGDILAQMDTSLMDAKIAVNEAEIYEAQATMSAYQQDIVRLIVQLGEYSRDAQVRVEECAITYMNEQARLDKLKEELARSETLKDRNLLAERDINSLRPEIAALQSSVDNYPHLIELHEKRVQQIKDQSEEVFAWMNMTSEGRLTDAVKDEMAARKAMIASSLERRDLQREYYTLKASADGIVSRVFHTPGSVVNAGDPVVLIVSEQSAYVVGFLAEVYLSELEVGHTVQVQRYNGQGPKINAVVESISPEIRALPGRVSPIRNQPLRGRRVIVKLERDDEFLPGETVKVMVPFRLKQKH